MKNKIILLLKLILTSLLLAYIFIKIPFSSILNAIYSADVVLILVSVLLTIPVFLLSSFETKYLTSIQKMSISFKEILKVDLTTGFYSLFLPGVLAGGPVKWYKFSKYGSKSSAAAVVVYNRYLEILIVVFLGIIFSFPSLITRDHENLLLVWFAALILLLACYLLPLHANSLMKIEKLFDIIPLPQVIKVKAKSFFNAMHQFQNLSLEDHLKIFFLMLIYHFISVLSFYALTNAINISINIFVLGWIRSVIMIVTMIPISISGFGVREWSLVYLLNFYGIPAGDAVALSFLSYFKNLTAPIAGGILELKDFLFSKNKKKGQNT